jgi:heme/copper-type cytochrome/quinol oxidase subunit 1
MQTQVDPALFQYLFWFYSHPAICVTTLGLILTAAGVWFSKRKASQAMPR